MRNNKNMPEYIEKRKYKKGNSYIVRIPYYSSNGTRTKYTKAFQSWKYGGDAAAKKEATIHRDIMKAKILKNEVSKSDATFEDIVKLKIETCGSSSETNRKLQGRLNKYIYPIINKKVKFKDITFIDITRVLNKARSIATQDTLKSLLSCFKQLYRTAIINDIVSVDQTIKVKMPNSLVEPKSTIKTTSFKEINDVIDNLQKLKNKELADKITLLIWIMYYTGIRPAEALALHSDDIDLKHNIIFINKAIRYDENRIPFISTLKTSNSKRVLPIDEELYKKLESIDNGYLFEFKGHILSTSYIGSIFRNIGSGSFHLYQLRHQFATDLIKNNTDLKTVQDLMGHNDPSTTMNYAKTNFNDFAYAIANRKKT